MRNIKAYSSLTQFGIYKRSSKDKKENEENKCRKICVGQRSKGCQMKGAKELPKSKLYNVWRLKKRGKKIFNAEWYVAMRSSTAIEVQVLM